LGSSEFAWSEISGVFNLEVDPRFLQNVCTHALTYLALLYNSSLVLERKRKKRGGWGFTVRGTTFTVRTGKTEQVTYLKISREYPLVLNP
jgi:hypothetical protein